MLRHNRLGIRKKFTEKIWAVTVVTGTEKNSYVVSYLVEDGQTLDAGSQLASWSEEGLLNSYLSKSIICQDSI